MLKYIRKRILKYKEKQIKDNFRTLKIDIQNYELLKPSVWQRIFKCLKKLYEMYPEIELGVLNLIEASNNIEDPNKVAFTNFNYFIDDYFYSRKIKIVLNEKYFHNINYFKKTKIYTNININ